MPTYQEEVLADNPALYLRLDMIGAASNGDVITDLSGNDLHGELDHVQPGTTPAPYGYASPIETDAASREFRGFNQGIFAGTQVSRIGVPTVPLIEPDFDFTVEGWLRLPEATSGGAAFGTIMQPMFGRTNSVFVYIDHFEQIAGCAIDTDDDGWLVVDPVPVAFGTSYHVVLTRLGSTLALYVNGYLKTSTTITSALANRMDAPGTFLNAQGSLQDLPGFFVHPFQVLECEARYDEVAFYDHALSAARVLVHYEAAKSALSLSATINVRVVVELDTDQAIPINFPFAHNFAEPLSGSARPIVEHLGYKTNVLQSEPDYQQRINAQPHHAERTLEYFVTPTSARARAMLQAALWAPGQTYKLPICKDWGSLTAQADSSDNTLSLDTTLRDYEIGSYVVAWKNIYQPWTAQFFQITSRSDTQLGIAPNVGDVLPIGSPVMPVRLAILPDDDLTFESHLIDRETAALQFEILSTELSTRRVSAYTPSETYLDLEVFSLERAKVEWVDSAQYQVGRRKESIGTAAGNDFQRAIDTGSPQSVPMRVLLTDRASQAQFYGWLEARQGKQNHVWIVSEESDLNVIARGGTSITIEHIGYASLYNTHSARRHLAFKKTDGSVIYKMVTAAVDNLDGTETLSVSSPPLLADIVKVSFLKLCTAPDQFEINYHRDSDDSIAECSFVMSELLTTPEPA